ncbi:MAG: hypothetical protein DI527_07555 [Chelatococcus sp.]|nr:MAG: hypothetical protein DI527_07555 [Chelatococcus sp.]
MSILLSRAREGQCRWIVCEAGPASPRAAAPDLFGGRRVCGAPVSGLTSYCAEHRLRVYERAPAPRPPIDLATARRLPAPDLQPELTEIFG